MSNMKKNVWEISFSSAERWGVYWWIKRGRRLTTSKKNIIEELNEFVSKTSSYITLYADLITVAAVLMVFSELKELESYSKLAFIVSSIFFGISGFFGMTGVIIYIVYKGEPSDFLEGLMNIYYNISNASCGWLCCIF